MSTVLPVSTAPLAGTEPAPRNRVAVVGLGFAITGLVVALIPFATFFAWFLTLPALILGIVGATRKQLPRRAAGWAIALSVAGWLASIAMSIVTFAVFGTISVHAGS